MTEAEEYDKERARWAHERRIVVYGIAQSQGSKSARVVNGRPILTEGFGDAPKRRKAWRAPKAPMSRGYWKLYVEHVNQASEGCDLDFLVGSTGDRVSRESH